MRISLNPSVRWLLSQERYENNFNYFCLFLLILKALPGIVFKILRICEEKNVKNPWLLLFRYRRLLWDLKGNVLSHERSPDSHKSIKNFRWKLFVTENIRIVVDSMGTGVNFINILLTVFFLYLCYFRIYFTYCLC